MKSQFEFAKILRWLALIIGVISTVLGVMVIIGWYTHNRAILEIIPGMVAMQYNTALGFLFSGLGLIFTIEGKRKPALITASIAFLLGFLTALEYVFGFNLGIDEMFMEHYITSKVSFPGRMAPNTSFCFTLTGLTLFVFNSRSSKHRKYLIGGTLGILIFSLGIVAFTGYLSGVTAAVGWGNLTVMAVHTASGFILLGLALFFYAWKKDLYRTDTVYPEWIAYPFGLGLLSFSVAMWQAINFTEGNDLVLVNITVLIYTIMVSSLLAFSTRLAQKTHKKNRILNILNTKLEKDIIQREKAELEIKKLNEQLEHKVKERTEDLEQEKEFSEAIIEAIPALFYTFDKNQKYVRWNKVHEKISGLTHEQMHGANPMDIIAEEDKAKVQKSLEQVYSKGYSEIEAHVVDKHGNEIPVLFNGYRFEMDGEVFVVGVGIDITDRKALEKQIEAQKDELQKYLDLSPIAVSITKDGNLEYLNNKFKAISGLNIGDSVKGYYVDIDDRMRLIAELQKSKFVSNQQVQIYNKDKNILDTLISMNILDDDEQQTILSWVVDISELKRIEEELKDANEEIAQRMQELHKMVMGLPIATALYQENGEVLILNEEFVDLTGYTIEDIPTFDSHWELFYPDENVRKQAKEDYYESTEESLNSQKPSVPYEDTLTDKSGRKHVVEIHTQSVGPLTLAMMVDLDERKKFEENLKEAKEIAEAATQAKSSFLANMSHEIRTPMNAVLGFSELLEKMIEDDVQKSYLNSIQSSGKSLLALINDILDLSKIEAGKLDVDFALFNVKKLIQEVETVFSIKVQEKGISLQTNIDSKVPDYILLDEVRLRQVLVNLVSNAVKFTSEGFIQINVKATDADSNDKVNLTFEVVDSGIGISEEWQAKIFESFTQTEGQDVRKYGGTGLGLTITKNLSELMNGKIRLESELGKGSTFSIDFENVEFDNHSIQNESHESLKMDQVEFEKATLLIIDDIPDNRKFLEGALKNYDFTIIQAENGQEGIEKMKAEKPDLVITDLKMPVMDGFAMMDYINTDKNLRSIPIIATSASVMYMDEEKAKEHKFSGFMVKPIQLDELVTQISNHIPFKEIKSQAKDDSKEAKLEIESPEEFLNELKNLEAKAKELSQAPGMDESGIFASKCVELGEQNKVESLIDFGYKLGVAVDSFDIELLMKQINTFHDLVKELENALS